MVEQLPLTALLNKALAGPVNALLNAVHVHAENSQAPISNAVAMELLVVVIMLLVFVLVRARLSVENPGGLQHVFEGLHGFIQGQSDEIIGHHSEPYTPFLVALFTFVLIANLLGLVPGFESPTAVPYVPLGLALCAFLYYNAMGIKKQGVGRYAAHFMGPSDKDMSLVIRVPLAVLMIPIEIVSHVARVMSLTIRLFANMFAGDMVTLVFFSLVPLGIPVLFLGLHLFVSLLQAYIFALLTTVYLAGAVAEEH